MAIRLVLAEDSYLMRDGNSSLIEIEGSLELDLLTGKPRAEAP